MIKLLVIIFIICPLFLYSQIINGDFSDFEKGKLKKWEVFTKVKKNKLVQENKIIHSKNTPVNITFNQEEASHVSFLLGKEEILVGTFKEPLVYNKIYKINFRVYHNLSPDNLRKIYFYITKKFKCSDTVQSPYMRFSGLNIEEKNKWHDASFYFLSSGLENNIAICNLIRLDKKNESEQFLIGNINYDYIGDIHELYKDSTNLVIDGGFEMYYFCSNGFFSGTSCAPLWEPAIYLDSTTLNTNKVKQFNFNAPFSSVPKYSVLIGSADIHCTNAKDMGFGDSIINAFEGNCFGKIGIQHSNEKFDEKKAYGEYLQTKLKQPLIKDKKYEVHIAFRKEPRGDKGVNLLGIKFTNIPFTMNEIDYAGKYHECDILLSEEPIIEEGKWLDSTYTFTAKGGEEYITIGRFMKTGVAKKTARANGKSGQIAYLIDDISVILKEE